MYRYYTSFIFLSFLGLSFCASAQFASQSVLKEGELYKIAVAETGIHRLSYEWLKEQLNVEPNDWAVDQIQIFGNHGGRLPEANAAERMDDLRENAIQIVGDADGQFNAGDYILFYAENADKIYYREDVEMWLTERNPFDSKNYYFLRIGIESGKRITTQASLDGADYTSNSFDDFIHFEEDEVNLLDEFDQAQGSGKRWYGDKFDNVEDINYRFSFPNLIPAEPLKIRSRLVARSRNSQPFFIDANGTRLQSNSITNTRGSFREPSESTYANSGLIQNIFSSTSDDINLTVTYEGEEGWLDYITLNARRELRLMGQQLRFSDSKSLAHEISAFELNASGEIQIWDITDPFAVQVQSSNQSADTYIFGYQSDTLKTFIAFQDDQTLEADDIQPLPNQNLHTLQAAEMLIIYPKDFIEQAERLATHRRTYSNLKVENILIDDIFNEFSSGRQDPSAIRDFVRMLYGRDINLKFLLLFGDGSFDYRNIKARGNNFITVYETDRSEDPIDAFPSDDFYGLLDEEEGLNLRGDLDIAIGRLPVKSLGEARQVVDKIIRYDTDDASLGDWRNRVAFVADDEDNNLHLRDTDFIAEDFKEEQPAFNQEKIYFDAFPQKSTSGGEGFPDATEAITQTLFKGVLAINYLGHGGSQGWAQERVLDKNRGDIKKLDNRHQLPVFVTATCSFSGYDDPNQVTGGEEVLLNPQGGGIALFTTVRAVYASSNASLVRSVFDTMFQLVEGARPTLGQIMQNAKNASSVGRSANSRKFTLLGDPAQPLALPLKEVVTTSVSSDTLRALQQVTISGEIRNFDGSLADDFNGILTPSIFDKSIEYTTLAQDAGSKAFNFDLQKNVIFKGRASVESGKFQFTFVMPKDINFNFGNGRISYYAKDLNTQQDAAGVDDRIIIGGADEDALSDTKGPEIAIFMDDESFVFGDETASNTLLIVKLQDDNGINVSGNSIGHDLEAVLDENTQNTILLNDFYEAELNDYTGGTAVFPLRNLADGLHQIEVTAWDIANNSSRSYTEFIVASSQQSALQNVLTFPNPFSESTCFEFEHQYPNQELDLLIQIYNVEGKLVKTIQDRIFANGTVVEGANCILWDGKGDSSAELAEGIYLYRIQISPTIDDGKRVGESKWEKLVLLR
ncbi:MAG: type IX secretion system sortase PorU [Bacteroidota bacterium]